MFSMIRCLDLWIFVECCSAWQTLCLGYLASQFHQSTTSVFTVESMAKLICRYYIFVTPLREDAFYSWGNITQKLLVWVCFKKYFIYWFSERGEGKEKEWEKHQCVVASHVLSTGDLSYNPGMFPDWESNWWPFGSQAGTQPTEPHKPGPYF